MDSTSSSSSCLTILISQTRNNLLFNTEEDRHVIEESQAKIHHSYQRSISSKSCSSGLLANISEGLVHVGDWILPVIVKSGKSRPLLSDSYHHSSGDRPEDEARDCLASCRVLSRIDESSTHIPPRRNATIHGTEFALYVLQRWI